MKRGAFTNAQNRSPQLTKPNQCPQCSSQRIWRDGLRYRSSDEQPVQRWLCRNCGLRFSQSNLNDSARLQIVQRVHTKPFYRNATLPFLRRVCVTETEGSKNLAEETTRQETAAGATTQTIDSKSKILEYAWWLKKNGKSDSTIEGRIKLLKILVKRGANLYDPETLKDVIAKQPWSNGRKNNACDAYSSFLKMVGGKWETPNYQTIRKLPFIPKETEIDQLIAGCSKRMATFLQTLKETGARCGEIWWLKWEDIDFESNTINITPEKNSNPRVNHMSKKLIAMLSQLPRTYGDRVFSNPNMPVDHHARGFSLQRKRIANKTGNPRLLKIHFHTFRHWKGTILYHKTKDMYYVMQALGHKNIKNTLLYVQLEEALFQGEQDYISKVAKTEKDICALIEVGFEYVTEFEGAKIFRKRKL